MNKKENFELRKRLQQLRVNEPLRVSKAGPAFRVPGNIPDSEAPRFEVPPRQPSQNEQARNEQTRSGSARSEISQIEHRQIEKTHVERAQIKPAKNEAARTELPRIEATQDKEAAASSGRELNGTSQGFFKLSHAIFSHLELQKLSGDCFRLFIWMSCRAWRFPNSGGKLRASVAYMEAQTGMGHATISRGLRALKEVGLVSLEETNFKTGNLWQVSALAVGNFEPENEPPQNEKPLKEAARNEQEVTSKRGTSFLKMSEKLPQNEQHIRNINKHNNSQESAPERAQIEVAVVEFESNLSEKMRQKITEEFVAREYSHGIYPPAKVIKSLVAMQWYEQQAVGKITCAQ